MLSFDPRPIIFFTFCVLALLLLILVALYRSIPYKLFGLKEGVLAGVAWTIGGGLILCRTILPDAVSLVLGNIAFSAGAIFMFLALRAYCESPLKARNPLWFSFLLFCIIFIAVSVKANYVATLSTVVIFNMFGYLLCLTAASNLRPRGFASLFLTTVVAIAFITAGIRILTLFYHAEIPLYIFDKTVLHQLYLAMSAFLTNALLLGFTFMTYQKVRTRLMDANSTLESEVAVRTADLRLESDTKRDLQRQLATIVEEERRRIGHELHDDLGQRLTGITLFAEVLLQELSGQSEAVIRHADAIQKAATEAIVEVRNLAHGLMPVGPEPWSLRSALEDMARSACVPNFTCSLEYDEPVDITQQDVANNLFRIAQQALSNTIAHSKATVMVIRLDLVNGKVHLEVSDNGCGFLWPQKSLFDSEANSCKRIPVRKSGRGLGIMQARAALINYDLSISSNLGRGTIIKAVQC